MDVACLFFSMIIMEKVGLTPAFDGRIYVVCNQDSATLDECYRITMSKYPKCSCAPFRKIHNNTLGEINHVNIYAIYFSILFKFFLVLLTKENEDEIIHNNTWTLASLHKLLSHDLIV